MMNTNYLQTAGNSFSVSNVSVEVPTQEVLAGPDRIDPAGALPALHAKPGIAVVPTRFGVVYVADH
jgi:hypothetical protein